MLMMMQVLRGAGHFVVVGPREGWQRGGTDQVRVRSGGGGGHPPLPVQKRSLDQPNEISSAAEAARELDPTRSDLLIVLQSVGEGGGRLGQRSVCSFAQLVRCIRRRRWRSVVQYIGALYASSSRLNDRRSLLRTNPADDRTTAQRQTPAFRRIPLAGRCSD